MNIGKSNRIFRRAIIREFFEPRLISLDFKRSRVRHPTIDDDGLTQSDLLHVFFDVDTGSDYPDGDEWFIIDMLFPYDVDMPDPIKGADYFTTISGRDGAALWHHRELIRYKHGRSKKIDAALEFIRSKHAEMCGLLEPLRKDVM